jgi:hypothetical protein
MTRKLLLVTAICLLPLPAAAADDACANIAGDVVLSARTPEVDLYDAPNGKRVNTVKRGAFPACLAIASRAPNMMIQVTVNGSLVWVPPHMVNARLTGKKPAICRNLAMGNNDTKVGATRALGEDCPNQQKSKP